jgi:hypothetical protein
MTGTALALAGLAVGDGGPGLGAAVAYSELDMISLGETGGTGRWPGITL